jgi:hypothetical protein
MITLEQVANDEQTARLCFLEIRQESLIALRDALPTSTPVSTSPKPRSCRR